MNEELKNNIDGEIKSPKKRYSIFKRVSIVVLAVVIVVAGAGGISFAKKMKQLKDEGPRMFMLEKIVKDLNLTDAQKSQLQSIKDEIKAKMQSRKKDNSSGMSDFGDAFKQDKLDKETLKSIEQKYEANREEMKDFMMDELIKFHDVLTPDQRTQVVQKIQEMKDKHMKDHKDKPQNN